MAQPLTRRVQESTKLLPTDQMRRQVIVERATRMVLGDQEHPDSWADSLYVRGNEAKNVLVSEHARLVNVGLTWPRGLVQRNELLDGDLVAAPVGWPNAAEAALAKLPLRVVDADVEGYGPFYEVGLARALSGYWIKVEC